VRGIVERETVAGRAGKADGGITDGVNAVQIDDRGQQLHFFGQAVLMRLGQEGRIVVPLQYQEAGIRPRLPDTGYVGREILGADWRVDVTDEIQSCLFHLILEHADAVVTPGIIHAQCIKLFQWGLSKPEGNDPRLHRPGNVGSEEVGYEGRPGKASVSVVRGDKDRIPVSKFWHQANASDDSTIPKSRRQPSRSTTSCALRTQFAGSPAVSCTSSSISRPSRPPLAFWYFIQNSAPWRIWAPISPAGPVSARGIPILIGVSPRA